MAIGRYDREPSRGTITKTQDDTGLTLALEVHECGTLFIRCSVSSFYPQKVKTIVQGARLVELKSDYLLDAF